MSLLGETVVEEWLNLKGYFTIRGIKIGVNEIDLLAIKTINGEVTERRHIECQISYNPISWITSATKEMQKSGWKVGSARQRNENEADACVKAWITKKFLTADKDKIRQQLCSGHWTNELVIGKAKFPQELEAIKKHGVVVTPFINVIHEILNYEGAIKSAAGGDTFELMKWLSILDKNPTK